MKHKKGFICLIALLTSLICLSGCENDRAVMKVVLRCDYPDAAVYLETRDLYFHSYYEYEKVIEKNGKWHGAYITCSDRTARLYGEVYINGALKDKGEGNSSLEVAYKW
ncbi:MAG: hypothetical protein IJ680_02160 [Paludibacteraceae bacterium]|nr:hypothetical protein [Paludibacteraceae bacterium]